MSLKTRNLKKLASLSAIGAGAVAFTADKAEASVISSGPLNAKVGFKTGDSAFAAFGWSVSSSRFAFSFFRTHSNFASAGFSYNFRAIVGYASYLRFGTNRGVLHVVPAGATWGPVRGRSSSSFLVGARVWGKFSSSSGPVNTSFLFGNRPFSHEYALFQFETYASPTLYGWIELSYDVTVGNTNDQALGPELTIEGYAYDDSGRQLPAGSTVPIAPEPGTLASAGLAALAFGAAGMRRWRAARKA